MSDTPRTDVMLIAWDMTPEPKKLIDHARQLERELAYAKARIARLEEALSLVPPHCWSLYHPAEHRHPAGKHCPVEAIVRSAMEAQP